MITNEEIKKAKEGDQKAIEKICAATWEPLYRYIYYKVQNRHEAEDILQDTYVRTLKYIRNNRAPGENHLGFMKKISLNIIRDLWRKKKRQGFEADFLEINPKGASITDHQNDVTQKLLLENALTRLSKEQQTILNLRIIRGFQLLKLQG